MKSTATTPRRHAEDCQVFLRNVQAAATTVERQAPTNRARVLAEKLRVEAKQMRALAAALEAEL